MNIFYGKSIGKADVPAESAVEASLDTALEIFRNLDPHRGFIGVQLNEKFILQILSKKDGGVKIELLDTTVPIWDAANADPAFAASLIGAAFAGQDVFAIARAKLANWKHWDIAQFRINAAVVAAPPPQPLNSQAHPAPDPKYASQTATYTIRSIQSGDNAGLWVSIHFSSPDRELDVLHIVGGYQPSPQQIRLGLLPIYLERFDQKLSCYQGAKKIEAGERTLTVDLNTIGQNALRLPETLQFVSNEFTDAFKAAKEVLAKMKQFESGIIIHLH